MIRVVDAAMPDVKLVEPKRFGDSRGFFSEVFSRRAFAEAGLPADFVQDNHSRSTLRGTVRGLHFQIGEAAQDKLVRCARGAILDVAVDLRASSATFGRHVAVELSAENWRQLFVPKGFAHGFCTLSDDCEVLYKVTSPYSPAHDRGVLWIDPTLAIDWRMSPAAATLSDKDRKWPRFADLGVVFE